MTGPRDRIEIGYVARAHGIRGEIRVAVHDPESRTLASVDAIFVGDVDYPVVKARPTDGAWLVLLAGIGDRDRAEALRGQPVAVDRGALDLDDDDVLLTDMVGCEVVLPSGAPWGRVVAIELGPQDRLVIHDRGVERQLPIVDELILDIDLDAARVVVDPPEGLPETPIEDRG